MAVDKDTLYWLFSTVAQTYGAIVGVIGMLTVYRLQNLSNFIKEAMDKSIDRRNYYLGETIYGQDPRWFIEAWHKRKESREIRNPDDKKFLDSLSDDLSRALDQTEKIKMRGIRFLLAHLFIIIFSILALLFSKALEQHQYMAVSVLLLLFGAVGWSFWVMRNLFFALFETTKGEYRKRSRAMWKDKWKYVKELADKAKRRIIKYL